MMSIPHHDQKFIPINCAIITVSDTRTIESDYTGQLLQSLLTEAGHYLDFYALIKDEPVQIKAQLKQLGDRSNLDAIIINGGTGISPRDQTYETLISLLDKTLPGFGELFRFLSYQEIGSRAMASRAIAGVYRQKLVFSLPGSTPAVKLALEKLIVPELTHLVKQIKGNQI